MLYCTAYQLEEHNITVTKNVEPIIEKLPDISLNDLVEDLKVTCIEEKREKEGDRVAGRRAHHAYMSSPLPYRLWEAARTSPERCQSLLKNLQRAAK
jgi:hypothetical protein